MVCDMGLDQHPDEALETRADLHVRHVDEHSKELSNDLFWSTEARRAYLGCYYLSTQFVPRIIT